MANTDLPIVTRSRLVADLKGMGLIAGDTVMLHASVKAVGWIVGGPDMVIQALVDVVGPDGTLMMYVKCEECLDELEDWPDDWQQAYLEECPAFDPERTRALRGWSILTVYLRTWPGARRSNHPEAGMTAIGGKAEWITADHPLQYGYGKGSPLAKLCEVGGKVLLLGPLLENLTILHHAEHLADLPNKNVERYRWPMLQDGKRVWVEIEQFDTCGGIVDGIEEDYFPRLAEEYMAHGKGRKGKVGVAESYLFDAGDLKDFAVAWLEERYG